VSASRAVRLIIVGGVLVVGSWVVLMMIVLELLPSNLPLLFGSYLASIGGLALGMIGAVSYVSMKRGGR